MIFNYIVDGKRKMQIFCIYFKQESSRAKRAENLLEEIAKIGGTDNYFNSNSLESLYETFYKISDAIQINYKLVFRK